MSMQVSDFYVFHARQGISKAENQNDIYVLVKQHVMAIFQKVKKCKHQGLVFSFVILNRSFKSRELHRYCLSCLK